MSLPATTACVRSRLMSSDVNSLPSGAFRLESWDDSGFILQQEAEISRVRMAWPWELQVVAAPAAIDSRAQNLHRPLHERREKAETRPLGSS
jgi:hypothetical protein